MCKLKPPYAACRVVCLNTVHTSEAVIVPQCMNLNLIWLGLDLGTGFSIHCTSGCVTLTKRAVRLREQTIV